MVIKHYVLKMIIIIMVAFVIGANSAYILPESFHAGMPPFITTTIFTAFVVSVLFWFTLSFVNTFEFLVKKIRNRFKNNSFVYFLTKGIERNDEEEISSAYEYRYFVFLSALIISYFGIYVPNLKHIFSNLFFIISAIATGCIFKSVTNQFEEHSVQKHLNLVDKKQHAWVVENWKNLEEIFHKLSTNTALIINKQPASVTRLVLLDNLKELKISYETLRSKIPGNVKYKTYLQDIEISIKQVKKMISDLEKPALIHLNKVDNCLKKLTHSVDKPYDYFLENIDDIKSWAEKPLDSKQFNLGLLKVGFYEMFTLVETILGYCANDFVEEAEYLSLKERLNYISDNSWRFFDFIEVIEKGLVNEKS